jgi:hypothetical protein
MRKIAAGLFVSVDGVVEAPDTWTGPYFSPELGQLIESMMGDGDTCTSPTSGPTAEAADPGPRPAPVTGQRSSPADSEPGGRRQSGGG